MKTAALQIKKLNKLAFIPKKGTAGAAGYDLFAIDESVVPAKGKGLVKTGLAIAVPTGNYARIAPRSGLAWKNFIDVGAGVIDEDYRGEVGVLLFNHSDVDFKVSVGDRVAQMIIEKITDTEIEEVETLEESVRGAGGFGSTGVSLNPNKQKVMDAEIIGKEVKPILSIEEQNKQIEYERTVESIKQLARNNKINEEQRIHICSVLRQGDEQKMKKILEEYTCIKEFDQLNTNFSKMDC